MNKKLLLTKARLYIVNIVFFTLNIFHIILASTTRVALNTGHLISFKILFFSSFNLGAFLTALILLAVQLVLAYVQIFLKFRHTKVARLTEKGIVDTDNHKLLKTLSVDLALIYKWVHELAAEQNIKSVKRIYVTDTSIPNAMTIDIVPIPFIRCSWIVLDANVLEILDEREIKAVISHELAHVKRLDAFVNLFRFGINFFLFVIYFIFLFQIIYQFIIGLPASALNIALRVGFFIVVLFVIWCLTLINRLLLNYSRQQAELLSDYYAANQVGRNHMINALVLLGQRLDVVAAFGKEFKWLGSLEAKHDVSREFVQGLKVLPAKEMSKKFIREEAIRIYVKLRLENIRDDLLVPLSEDQITAFTENASEELLLKREKVIQESLPKTSSYENSLQNGIINWMHSDEDSDLYLKDTEIDALVKRLEENPEKELFDSDVQNFKGLFLFQHPSMRRRILFLYYAIPTIKND